MKTTLFAACLLLASCGAQATSTLRCSSAIISLNDYAGEVLDKCGAPQSQTELGYREVVDAYGYRSEQPAEEWVYGPRSGMYYYLQFVGGYLTKIESKRKP
ncbi:MAG: DUF2845 domain-containing protein [Pseudomonas sp.]|uniref:DUF2845 domain-containing protein n=1 Tax=Pseudomonas sp. TaxID=306 RepID=UPI003394B2E1